MGYTTEFRGKVSVNPPLNPTETAYLTKFAETRRMQRERGPYFVDGTGSFGQGNDADITNGNQPPADQPSLWCDWAPSDDGHSISWNGTEKFYGSTEWMQYLIDHFLKPGAHAQGHPGFEDFTFDHTVGGVIDAQGEDFHDQWQLTVVDNVVSSTEQ
jgi:hypothetical protein